MGEEELSDDIIILNLNKNDFNKNTNIINSWDWVDKNPNTLYAKLIFQLKMKQ